MPLYEYQCSQCGRFEVIRKFSDEPLTACPTCGREISKLLSAPAIQFKGSGWYITDYARKGGNSEGKSGSGDSGSTSSTTESIKPSSGSKDSSSGKETSSTPTTTTSKDSSAKGSSPSK